MSRVKQQISSSLDNPLAEKFLNEIFTENLQDPTLSLIQKTIDLEKNELFCQQILYAIFRRLKNRDRSARFIYKGLVGLEYLLKTPHLIPIMLKGCKENIEDITALTAYKSKGSITEYEGKIREKSEVILDLIEQAMREEEPYVDSVGPPIKNMKDLQYEKLMQRFNKEAIRLSSDTLQGSNQVFRHLLQVNTPNLPSGSRDSIVRRTTPKSSTSEDDSNDISLTNQRSFVNHKDPKKQESKTSDKSQTSVYAQTSNSLNRTSDSAFDKIVKDNKQLKEDLARDSNKDLSPIFSLKKEDKNGKAATKPTKKVKFVTPTPLMLKHPFLEDFSKIALENIKGVEHTTDNKNTSKADFRSLPINIKKVGKKDSFRMKEKKNEEKGSGSKKK